MPECGSLYGKKVDTENNTMVMKKILIMCAVLVAGAVSMWGMPADNAVCNESVAASSSESRPKKELKEVTFKVNMHCGNCVKKIRENISFEKGVKGLEISLEGKTVKITYDASKTDEAKLAEALADLGYEAVKA